MPRASSLASERAGEVTRHVHRPRPRAGRGLPREPAPGGATLNVTGWVRNRTDGTVEAMVHGSPEDVFASWTGAARAASAHVTSVEVNEASGEFDHFEQLPSA